MSVLFLEYPKCGTCRRARNWLEEQKVEFDARHIIEQNPSAEELERWHKKSGLLVKRPLLVGEDFVLPGFRVNTWSEALL